MLTCFDSGRVSLILFKFELGIISSSAVNVSSSLMMNDVVIDLYGNGRNEMR